MMQTHKQKTNTRSHNFCDTQTRTLSHAQTDRTEASKIGIPTWKHTASALCPLDRPLPHPVPFPLLPAAVAVVAAAAVAALHPLALAAAAAAPVSVYAEAAAERLGLDVSVRPPLPTGLSETHKNAFCCRPLSAGTPASHQASENVSNCTSIPSESCQHSHRIVPACFQRSLTSRFTSHRISHQIASVSAPNLVSIQL